MVNGNYQPSMLRLGGSETGLVAVAGECLNVERLLASYSEAANDSSVGGG